MKPTSLAMAFVAWLTLSSAGFVQAESQTDAFGGNAPAPNTPWPA